MSEVQGVLIHVPDGANHDWREQGHLDDRRNVSPLHRELQHRAIKWMANRLVTCFASIEIGYGRGVVCDALGVGRSTARLVEAVDGLPWIARYASIVRCEVKISRADFMFSFGPNPKDRAADAECGNLRFLVKPRKVEMPLELLPVCWGVLEAYGAGLSTKRKATWRELPSVQDTFAALLSIIRLHPWGMRAMRVPCPDCVTPALEGMDV